MELTRARIHIDSVEHRMLRDSVGYIQIKSFQGNTEADLKKALQDLHTKRSRVNHHSA